MVHLGAQSLTLSFLQISCWGKIRLEFYDLLHQILCFWPPAHPIQNQRSRINDRYGALLDVPGPLQGHQCSCTFSGQAQAIPCPGRARVEFHSLFQFSDGVCRIPCFIQNQCQFIMILRRIWRKLGGCAQLTSHIAVLAENVVSRRQFVMKWRGIRVSCDRPAEKLHCWLALPLPTRNSPYCICPAARPSSKRLKGLIPGNIFAERPCVRPQKTHPNRNRKFPARPYATNHSEGWYWSTRSTIAPPLH